MNKALQARHALKLNEKEFSLLLGVSESAVLIEEIQSGEQASLSDSLYTLIIKEPHHTAQILIEERLSEASSLGMKEHRACLIGLTVKLHELQMV
jgi:hypothetical protein